MGKTKSSMLKPKRNAHGKTGLDVSKRTEHPDGVSPITVGGAIGGLGGAVGSVGSAVALSSAIPAIGAAVVGAVPILAGIGLGIGIGTLWSGYKKDCRDE